MTIQSGNADYPHVTDVRHLRALPQPAGASLLEMSAVGKRKVLDATLIGTHEESDLALLKVAAHGLPALALAATRPVYPGELVLAIGSPAGLEGSVTLGMVSSVWRQPDPDLPLVYIQTDAAINAGNSGGPLIDLDGNVIGLNTFILSRGGGSEGLGFAIPARVVRHGEVARIGHLHIGLATRGHHLRSEPAASGIRSTASVVASAPEARTIGCAPD